MAYDDTKWGGFAKIIVDTSTMSVGDTVRVKSMTTGTNYDKQVVTVGTPLLWENEIYKDYVKICMVQTINDTPTEVGGVYRELDYGETAFINVLNKTTLAGIQSILNAHQELNVLDIGDEVNVMVNNISTPFLIAGINLYENHEVIFASKYATTDTVYGTQSDYANSPAKTYMDNYFATFNEDEKAFIKDKIVRCGGGNNGAKLNVVTQKVWCPTATEILSNGGYGVPSVETSYNVRFPLFVTQNARVKTTSGGTVSAWWTASRSGNTGDLYTVNINTNGVGTHTKYNFLLSMLPCFHLTADS